MKLGKYDIAVKGTLWNLNSASFKLNLIVDALVKSRK
jgi:hypothetical protein